MLFQISFFCCPLDSSWLYEIIEWIFILYWHMSLVILWVFKWIMLCTTGPYALWVLYWGCVINSSSSYPQDITDSSIILGWHRPFHKSWFSILRDIFINILKCYWVIPLSAQGILQYLHSGITFDGAQEAYLYHMVYNYRFMLHIFIPYGMSGNKYLCK